MLKKREVVAYTKRLDKVADDIQENWKRYDLSKKDAYNLCLQVDTLSDKLEQLVGVDKKSDVIERDEDEPYMDYFDDDVHERHPEDDHIDNFELGDDAWSHQETLEGTPQGELTGGERTASWYSGGDTSSKTASRGTSSDYWNDSSSDYWE